VGYQLKVTYFNLPHLHLAPLLGVTRLNSAKIFWCLKTRSLGYHVTLFVRSAFSCFGTIPACDRHTHGQTTPSVIHYNFYYRKTLC